MNEATIFPRAAFTDAFVVEVLDVWRVENEGGLRGKSKVIVGQPCGGEVKSMRTVGRGADLVVSSVIENGHRLGRVGDENAHPTPDVLGTWHLAQFSTSVSPKKENGGCGGRRSLERVEHQEERDGDESGVL